MAQKGTWGFSQSFGDDGAVGEVSDADVLSAVEFDKSGEYLATGDKGGCICVFKRDAAAKAEDELVRGVEKMPFWKQKKSGSKTPSRGTPRGREAAKESVQFKFFAEFQSHEPGFDYLKSLEIEEKINKIKWCPPSNNSLMLLSTNDKTIKLWKVYEKKVKSVSCMNLPESLHGGRVDTKTMRRRLNSLKIPKLQTCESVIAAFNRRQFANAHAYHVNSISVCSDGETFLSADDLRINLWNTSISDRSFNVVDIKPDNMEELTEVITAAEFHPQSCNLFMYSSSCGKINICDMRDSALCDRSSQCLQEAEDPSSKSFFSEIIASISDVKFSPDGKYAISRDYLRLKVWDLAMPSRPVRVININEQLRAKLCDLYENDCIFDKFEHSISRDGNSIVTGTYHNHFHIYDRMGKMQAHLRVGSQKNEGIKGRSPGGFMGRKFGKKKEAKDSFKVNVDNIDFGQKILHVAHHPKQDIIAIGAKSQLFLYAML